MGIVVVMLLWTGGMPGTSAPATITGFNELSSCEKSEPLVRDWYSHRHQVDVDTECMVLPPLDYCPWCFR